MYYMFLPQLLFLPDHYTVQVAYPSESESELLEHLSEDYIKEVNCFQKSWCRGQWGSFFSSSFSGVLEQNGAKSKGCLQTPLVHSWGKEAHVPCWHALRLCQGWDHKYVWGTLAAIVCHFPTKWVLLGGFLSINPYRARYFLGTPVLAFWWSMALALGSGEKSFVLINERPLT